MEYRKAIALAISTMVLIGLAELPYGYYTVLRLAICGFALFLLFSSQSIQTEWHRWVTGAWAVIYNPIVPLRIGDKGIWIAINLMTVAWFWFIARQTEGTNDASKRSRPGG